MEAFLFCYTFTATFKIIRRLISEAGTLNILRRLSIRSQVLKWIFVTVNLIQVSESFKRRFL